MTNKYGRRHHSTRIDGERGDRYPRAAVGSPAPGIEPAELRLDYGAHLRRPGKTRAAVVVGCLRRYLGNCRFRPFLPWLSDFHRGWYLGTEPSRRLGLGHY